MWQVHEFAFLCMSGGKGLGAKLSRIEDSSEYNYTYFRFTTLSLEIMSKY